MWYVRLCACTIVFVCAFVCCVCKCVCVCVLCVCVKAGKMNFEYSSNIKKYVHSNVNINIQTVGVASALSTFARFLGSLRPLVDICRNGTQRKSQRLRRFVHRAEATPTV